MKKAGAALTIAFLMWAILPAVSPAQEGLQEKKKAYQTYLRQFGKKLERGATNVARAGTEFYFQPKEAERISGKRISALWPGLGEGFGMFLTRLLGGTIEVVTAPFPFPNGWKPLLEE